MTKMLVINNCIGKVVSHVEGEILTVVAPSHPGAIGICNGTFETT